jgi:hypothetical protein
VHKMAKPDMSLAPKVTCIALKSLFPADFRISKTNVVKRSSFQ